MALAVERGRVFQAMPGARSSSHGSGLKGRAGCVGQMVELCKLLSLLHSEICLCVPPGLASRTLCIWAVNDAMQCT